MPFCFIILQVQFALMTFNLFGKKEKGQPQGVFTDKTYISTAAKMNACLDLAKKEPNAIFIAWFPETARKFKAFYLQHGIPENRVIESRHVHMSLMQDKTAVFIEHYPMHNKELELVQHWPQQQFMVFSAMDEPLFKHFGSEKMIPLMKMLGMKEEEAIEHIMVSRSITKGQDKIASQVVVEQSADSQQRWMDINIRKIS